MVDEYFANFEHLSQESQSEFGEAMSNKQTLWIALSNKYGPKSSNDVTQIPRKLQTLRQTSFEEARMDIPLRSPRNVFEELKRQVNPTSGNQIDLNEHLLKNAQLPPTLTDGRFSEVEVNPESSLTEVLQACFKELPENKVGIIVIESFMNDFPEDVTCSCRNKVVKALFDNAFAQLRKKAPWLKDPLYWLDDYSDTIEEIKKSKNKRFLVTTYHLARGFEDSLIINLAGFPTFSRASAYLLTVFPTPNWPYLALSTLTSIFEKHEDSFAHQLSLDSPLVTTDKKLSALGLQKSKLVLGGRECPRIVLPILDLIRKDSKWSKSNFTMESLLINSLEVNSTLKNQFHPCFTQNQDIVKGLQDYYSWISSSFPEFTQKEDLLLQILANYLQRKIIFHPILKPIYAEEKGKTFGDNFEAVFHIFGYRFRANSYYISATNQ